MLEISFQVNYADIESILEKLEIIGLYYTYYDAPYEVTTDPNGYGYVEKQNETIVLKVYPDTTSREECLNCIDKIKQVLNVEGEIVLSELKDDSWQQPFEAIDLGNGWIIAEPGAETEDLKQINFESQGSFGTGLHETTQDLLRYILEEDFTGLTVFDLGTGSGILSIAAAIKNAHKVVALDIRDVTEEVMYNASLNNLNNIEVVIKDVTKYKFETDERFDFVFINIGGEETIASMKLINSVIKPNGTLMVSGLVEWGCDNFMKHIEENGYSLIKSTKTNEWVTLVYKKEE